MILFSAYFILEKIANIFFRIFLNINYHNTAVSVNEHCTLENPFNDTNIFFVFLNNLSHVLAPM